MSRQQTEVTPMDLHPGSTRKIVGFEQKRDVRTLLDDSVDWPYLREWTAKLGVNDMLEDVSK
jgi:hypothetical protein